jgi:hypothetical protein
MGGKSVKGLMACTCHSPSEVSEASVPLSRKTTLGTYDLEAGALGAICSAKVSWKTCGSCPACPSPADKD